MFVGALFMGVAALLGAPASSASAQTVNVSVLRYQQARAAHGRDEVKIIRDYYVEHPSHRPVVVVQSAPSHPGRGRGRGHGGGYAPGWEKKLRKHEALHADLRAYYAPAPAALIRVLPPLPRGAEYAVIGNRFVVVERPSWLVLDVLFVM